jgi:hypothetical protein
MTVYCTLRAVQALRRHEAFPGAANARLTYVCANVRPTASYALARGASAQPRFIEGQSQLAFSGPVQAQVRICSRAFAASSLLLGACLCHRQQRRSYVTVAINRPIGCVLGLVLPVRQPLFTMRASIIPNATRGRLPATLATAAAVAASAVLVCVQAQTPYQYEQCFDEYLCIFHYLNSGTSLSYKYSWDFRGLCRTAGNEYLYTDTYNHTVRYNICGMVSKPCVPSEYKVNIGMGVATQQWTEDPPCGPTPSCTLPEDGSPVCCTGDCTVLAFDIPRYSLMDPNNPVTGGIIMSHAGLPPE